MKANKTLKRLVKIETLLSDVKARYSVKSSGLRQVLQDATAAIARVKEIVSSQIAVKADRGARKAVPAKKKTTVKKTGAKGTASKSAKKNASRKKRAKKKAATMAAPSASHAVPEAASTSSSIGEVERAHRPVPD